MEVVTMEFMKEALKNQFGTDLYDLIAGADKITIEKQPKDLLYQKGSQVV